MSTPAETIPKGASFGRWTVLEDQAQPWQLKISCKCECGTKRMVKISSLRSKKSQSCGCLRNERGLEASLSQRRFYLNPGEVFGRLTVVRQVSAAKVECVCECGNAAIRTSYMLRNGKARSCGCLQAENRKNFGGAHPIHHKSTHPLYGMWGRIIRPYTDPNNPRWDECGARGGMHEPWTVNAVAFVDGVEADIGPQPKPGMSVVRINPDLGMRPGNIRWAPRGTGTRRSKLSVAQVTAMVADVDAGMTQAEVGKKYGVGNDVVCRWVQRVHAEREA